MLWKKVSKSFSIHVWRDKQKEKSISFLVWTINIQFAATVESKAHSFSRSCSRVAKPSARLLISLSVICKRITLENRLVAHCCPTLIYRRRERACPPIDPLITFVFLVRVWSLAIKSSVNRKTIIVRDVSPSTRRVLCRSLVTDSDPSASVSRDRRSKFNTHACIKNWRT